MQPCDTIRASASKEPAGVARESPPRDITVLGCCQMPLSRRIIGLVSLLQRCRRARASAGTLDGTHEPTPMQTTLVLRRTMRITSASPQSYSFLDLTGPHRGPPYAQYGHSRHIMGLYDQQARRRTMLHNVTPDLAKSSGKVRTRVHGGFDRLEMLPTPKNNGLTVKVAGLRSVSAVRDGPAKGQSTLHRRDRREWGFPRGLRAHEVGSEFRTGAVHAPWFGL